MTNLEAKQHLARKLNIDYSDLSNNDLFSETDLQVFVQLGVLKAWDYRPWPFTQKTKTATTVDTDYYDHPSDLMNGSIYLLKVNGKEYKKIHIQDYLKYLEDNPSAQDRLWSENETFIFINKNAHAVGVSFDLYGKKFPVSLSGANDLLPFSPTTDNSEHSGNEAIVQLAYAEALASEKKKEYGQAEAERKKAYDTLAVLWKPFAEQRALLQSKGRPMFNTRDFFGGAAGKSSIYNGNFDYLN